jgi:hypothetical protein
MIGVPSPLIRSASASFAPSGYVTRWITGVFSFGASFHSATVWRLASLSPVSATQTVPSGAIAMSSGSRASDG